MRGSSSSPSEATPASEGSAGRNDPCPCGSGRKYKNCCLGRATSPPARKRARPLIRLGLFVLVLFLLGIGVSRTWLAPDPAGTAPEPWYYDEANDRHWHPGHNHWHPGPPPSESQRTESASAPTPEPPEPWHYDEANDRHWHPGHNHWHQGPPPPPDQR